MPYLNMPSFRHQKHLGQKRKRKTRRHFYKTGKTGGRRIYNRRHGGILQKGTCVACYLQWGLVAYWAFSYCCILSYIFFPSLLASDKHEDWMACIDLSNLHIKQDLLCLSFSLPANIVSICFCLLSLLTVMPKHEAEHGREEEEGHALAFCDFLRKKNCFFSTLPLSLIPSSLPASWWWLAGRAPFTPAFSPAASHLQTFLGVLLFPFHRATVAR